MMNIPTDLLRTLVAVVDLRSFTKAAQSLRRDPAGGQRADQAAAVSARLRAARQERAGRQPDAARARGGQAPRGGCCRSTTRSCSLTSGGHAARTLRVGIPGDFIGARIPDAAGRVSASAGRIVRFIVNGGSFDQHAARICSRASSTSWSRWPKPSPRSQPRHLWTEQAVWVRSEATQARSARAGAAGLLAARTAPASASRCRRSTGSGATASSCSPSRSLVSLAAAVVAGFGVMVMPRSRRRRHQLVDLGGCAAAARCPTSIAAYSCARAATGRRSIELASSPTIMRGGAMLRRTSRRAEPRTGAAPNAEKSRVERRAGRADRLPDARSVRRLRSAAAAGTTASKMSLGLRLGLERVGQRRSGRSPPRAAPRSTAPKPLARTSGVTMLSRIAMRRRSSSTSLLRAGPRA